MQTSTTDRTGETTPQATPVSAHTTVALPEMSANGRSASPTKPTTTTTTTTTTTPASSSPKSFVDKLEKTFHIPPWFTPYLTDRRQWKNFIRCMLATLGTLVLMLCQTSLNVMGQAAFFGALVSQMLPPYMALSVYIFALLTLIVGMCFGWAWGVAAMAAALRARSQQLLAQQVQSARAGYNQNANIEAQYQESIFRGEFLDPRTSAVYGVFLFFGTYFLGLVRATRPRLILASIFGTIIMDLMCSYGPLFPIQVYTLARQLLIPAAMFIAIALASVILIFPQTLNHIMLDSMTSKMLGPITKIVKLQEEVLNTSPGDKERWSALATKAYALRHGQIAATTALEGQTGLLQLEITRGQIGPRDLTKIFNKVKDLGIRAYGLTSFVLIVEEQSQSLKNMDESPLPHPVTRAKDHFKRMDEQTTPSQSLEQLLPLMEESTSELRLASTKALDDIATWLYLVNHTRWKKVPANATPIAEREANLAAVKASLAEFRASKHFVLLEPYREHFDHETGTIKKGRFETHRASSRALFRCFVLTSNLIAFSLVLIELLEMLLQIERANPKSKIQLPNAFAKMLVKSANDKQGGGNPLDLGLNDGSAVQVDQGIEPDEHNDAHSETSTAVEGKGKPAKVFAKDPDAGDPRNVFQKIGRGVSTLWKGATGSSGLFALKYALVSVALWIPAVCPASAYFNYTNRGLWALIMAQTGLGVFTGEQILSFIVRMAGTVLGLILGMLAWYIGAGSGSGNPYGIAAATMVLIAPCLFIRIAIPLEKSPFFLMTNVTLMFIVGYSWVDEHTYQTANQGSGASLAGRRALLVIIGFTAAFIIMIFPRPISARLLFRHRLAKNMADIGDLYGRVVTGIEGEWDTPITKAAIDTAGRRERYKGSFLKVMGRLLSMEQQLTFAVSEPGFKGPWPRKKYEALFKTQGQVIATLALLSGSYSRMEVDWCKRLAKRSELMHPAFISDCISLFSILQQSLHTGEPLPPLIPIFERLAFHHNWAKAEASLNRNSSIDQEKAMPTVDNGLKVDGAEMEARNAMEILENTLTWDRLHDEQLPIFATANIALVHIAIGLNDMYRVVRELVGEKDLKGLDRASERWARGDVGV
ncbi:hypothetical protein CI109_102211 [Kwoniella shandongensis]|uniref:Uncharacterized protein n=1 Tax=Kwoniella shandongensis TaxID=1734106 RepID=A0A5M6C0D3_9TREE|nr:uncharacterized protein CI109_003635 [Kwoniella shandongensis]KAA5527980.1 hypothetical protein CI109_003635 [Kwoniella shandongensis]